MTKFASQPTGTAYQTISTPQSGAQSHDSSTRMARLTRFAIVNIFTSPAPRRMPSTAILKPMKQKKKPMNCR